MLGLIDLNTVAVLASVIRVGKKVAGIPAGGRIELITPILIGQQPGW